MATQAELETQLAELRTAIHKKLTGQQVREQSSDDGTRVVFADVSLSEMRAQESVLVSQIAAFSIGQQRRPIIAGF